MTRCQQVDGLEAQARAAGDWDSLSWRLPHMRDDEVERLWRHRCSPDDETTEAELRAVLALLALREELAALAQET